MKHAQHIIETYQTLKGERANLNSLFEEIAEVLSPERSGFISQHRTNGRRTDKIFDTLPITAKRSLVNAVGGMLRPKSSAPGKWFDVVPEDEELGEVAEVKKWIEFVEERMWRAMYNPKAQFIQSTGETDDDLISFGTGSIYTGVRNDQSGMKYKAFHLKDTYLIVDQDNNPSGSIIVERLTAKQAAQRWGEDKLHEKMKRVLERNNPDDIHKKFTFQWCVKPRYDRDPGVKNNLNMPVGSYVVDEDNEHLIEEEGFEEYPFAHPRWDTRSGEIYGRGPGVLALPDVLTLNQMGKTMLRAMHRAVDPSWLLPSDSMVTAPNLTPGGVGYYDAKAIRNLGLSNPFQQMTSDAKITWGLNAQQATREQIMAVFFRNVLNLPVSGPAMTATEVIQRREEFVREIGSVFGRLESDYTGPLVERTFNIMMRRGAFGGPTEIPEDIQGAGISFRFASPVEKAKKQIEESTITQGIEKVLAIGQVQPEVMRPYNWTEIGKFIGESNDFPSKLMLSQGQIKDKAEQEAAAAQQEQKLREVERVAGVAKQLPDDAVMGAMQR
jgi:hypothetical protein